MAAAPSPDALSSLGRIGPENLDNGQFVDLVNQRLLGRVPDPTGKSHWTEILESGTADRSQFVYIIADSPEFRALDEFEPPSE